MKKQILLSLLLTLLLIPADSKDLRLDSDRNLISRNIIQKLVNPKAHIMKFKDNTQIAFLPQIHHEPDANIFYTPLVALSQFQIAQTLLYYINKGEEVVVFDENQIAFDKPRTDYGPSEVFFPEGIPTYFKDLDDHQRYTLHVNGGAATLYHLGKIKHIYKTITQEDHDYYRSKMDPTFPKGHEKNRPWVRDFREQASQKTSR